MNIERSIVRRGLALVAGLCLAGQALAQPSPAQSGPAQANSAQAWLESLLSSHAGRDFCPPDGTTVGGVAGALAQYAAKHVAADQPVTDAQWLQMLAAIYPCASARPLQPAGAYAAIDTKPMTALLDALSAAPPDKLQAMVDKIELGGADYPPPVLLQVSAEAFKLGKLDDALFWFHAGLLRAILDAQLCSDPSVAGVPNLLVNRMPPELVKAAFSGGSKAQQKVQDAIAWDRKTAYNYDHRWIALSGAGAVRSARDPAHAPATLTVPEDKWPQVMEGNRALYPLIVARDVSLVSQAAGSAAPLQ